MKKQYKDFYGCTATILHRPEDARLIVRLQTGKKIKDSVHKNFDAARSAMYRCSDSWHQL